MQIELGQTARGGGWGGQGRAGKRRHISSDISDLAEQVCQFSTEKLCKDELNSSCHTLPPSLSVSLSHSTSYLSLALRCVCWRYKNVITKLAHCFYCLLAAFGSVDSKNYLQREREREREAKSE